MFGVWPPTEGCSSSGWVSLLERAKGSEGSDISWSLKLLFVGLLRLETCVELPMQGFACPAGCERVSGGLVVAGASSFDLPPFLACESDGALEGGFGLLARATPWAVTRGSKSSPVFALRGVCVVLDHLEV